MTKTRSRYPARVVISSHSLFAPLAWATLYFACGFLSYLLNGAVVASGYLWLPAGVTVAALMFTRVRQWAPLLVLLLAAQLLLSGIAGRELWRMAVLAIDEIGVAAVAVWWVIKRQRAQPTASPLEGMPFVRALLLVSAGASLVSGLFGALWLNSSQNLPFWSTLRVWACSDLVGILIVTPLLASWSRVQQSRAGEIGRTEFLLGLMCFGALLLSTWLAFGSELDRVLFDINFSTTYLPLLCVALVTILWGGRGGSLAVAVLALMAFVYNSLGRGPFADLLRLHSSNALLELQVYLAVAALLSLLIGALKTTRALLHEETARWRTHVGLALDAGRQLVYSIDAVRGAMTWSGDMAGLLGVTDAELATLEQVLTRVHPLDQARLRRHWLDHDDGDDPDAEADRAGMAFRLMHPGGRITHVTDACRGVFDADGELALVAGIWHVTDGAAAGDVDK